MNNCSLSTKKDIKMLSYLKDIFEQYYNLVSNLYKNKRSAFLENASYFNKKDKFIFLLDKNIKELIDREENISN